MLGRQVSHYQVVEKIGEGGMGVVWKARDLELGRFVALKMLPSESTANESRRQRFVQEARAASALNHPNIVTIHDLMHEDGVSFLVMEFVYGRTLDQVIPRSGLRVNEALRIAAQIASALEAAHSAGIVHRDLKPGNVMVTGNGTVKVLDFGLAKLLETAPPAEQDATLTVRPPTEDGAIVGTIAYMSPEQAEGKPVDARSDIFSFGAVLYEMLSGRRAFQAESKLATLTTILHKDPQPVRELVPALPGEVDKLVARCLRKNPARRWQGMSDLKVTLDDLKEESDSGALSGAEPASVSPPRRRWLIPALAVAALAAAGLVAWKSRWPSREAIAPMTLVPLTIYEGVEGDPSFSPDGSQFAFSWDGEKQDNSDIYVRLVAGGTPLRLTTDPVPDARAAWSPDGRWIAFMRQIAVGRLAVILVPPLGGRERQLAELHIGATQPSLDWSPDSQWLVSITSSGSGTPRGLCLISAQTGEIRRLTDDALLDARFSPDGRVVAFFRSHAPNLSEIFLQNLTADYQVSGEPVRFTHLNRFTGDSLAWTADGREILFPSGRPGNVSFWRQALGETEARRVEAVAPSSGIGVAISRLGRVAVSRRIRDIQIVKAELAGPGGPVTRLVPIGATTRLDRYPSWSQDGTRIAFSSDRTGNWEIWTCDADGGNPFQVTSMAGPEATRPVWSPDGRWIAFSADVELERKVFVVAAGGGSPRQVTRQAGTQDNPSWSPDGNWIRYLLLDSSLAFVGVPWKVPAAGGSPVRETIEPLGGDLRREPGSSGPEVPRLVARGKTGEYFFTGSTPQTPGTVLFRPPSGGPPREVTGIDRASPYGFSLSPDERSLLYSRFTRLGGDIFLLENFR